MAHNVRQPLDWLILDQQLSLPFSWLSVTACHQGIQSFHSESFTPIRLSSSTHSLPCEQLIVWSSILAVLDGRLRPDRRSEIERLVPPSRSL